jgi:DNA polymerase
LADAGDLAVGERGDLGVDRGLLAAHEFARRLRQLNVDAEAASVDFGAGDFSAVEARILAWLAGETWKLDAFRRHDRTGDPALDFYLIAASQVLKRRVKPDDEAGRQVGKTCELAFGFGGASGAWRRFDADGHSDQEVNEFVQRWRQAHPATTRFWRRLESAIKRTVRSGERGTLGNLVFEFEAGTLRIVLPSERRICYPETRLVPGKFGDTAVAFKDNARGGWADVTAWHGSFTENVVQGIARDLLVAAMFGSSAPVTQSSCTSMTKLSPRSPPIVPILTNSIA